MHDFEDPDMDVIEDPEEDPQEVIPPVVASPLGSLPISSPPLSESSSDSNFAAPVTTDGTFWVPPSGSTFEIGGPSFVSSASPHLLGHEVRRLKEDTETLFGSVGTLTWGMKTRRTEIVTTRTSVDRVRRHMDAFDVDIAFVEQATARLKDDVIALQNRAETAKARLLQVEQDRIKDKEEIERLKTRVESTEVNAALAAMDRDRIKMELYMMRDMLTGLQLEITRRGAKEARPTESINILAVYGDARPLEPQGPSDNSY
ncbi:hypothetical protein Tco_0409359 [Tanacetum coccineum]